MYIYIYIYIYIYTYTAIVFTRINRLSYMLFKENRLSTDSDFLA